MKILTFIPFLILFWGQSAFHTKESLKSRQVPDTNLVRFIGETQPVQYGNNRKIKSAPFKITNYSNSDLKVSLIKATLLRGNSEDNLDKTQIEVLLQGQMKKCSEFTIKANSSKNFNITFKGFTIYAGSQYTIKAVITIDGATFEAFSPLKIYKLRLQDKNKYKQGSN